MHVVFVFHVRSFFISLNFIACCVCVCSRLAEECASDPLLKENTFTAPSKQSHAQDSLESLCRLLLHCCDSVWIPTIIVRTGCTHAHRCTKFFIYLIFTLWARGCFHHNFITFTYSYFVLCFFFSAQCRLSRSSIIWNINTCSHDGGIPHDLELILLDP